MNSGFDDRSFVLSGVSESEFFEKEKCNLISLREYLNILKEKQERLKKDCSKEINKIISENDWMRDIKFENRPYYYNYIHNINMVAIASKYNMGMEYDFSTVSDFFPLNYTYSFDNIERQKMIEQRMVSLCNYSDELKVIFERGSELFKGFGDVRSISNSFKIVGIDSVDILSSYYKMNYSNSDLKSIYKSHECVDASILDRIQLRLKK